MPISVINITLAFIYFRCDECSSADTATQYDRTPHSDTESLYLVLLRPHCTPNPNSDPDPNLRTIAASAGCARFGHRLEHRSEGEG